MKLPSPDQVLGNKNTLPSPSDVLGTVKKKVASKPRSQEELWGSDSQPQDLYTSLVTGAQEPQQESDGLGGPPSPPVKKKPSVLFPETPMGRPAASVMYEAKQPTLVESTPLEAKPKKYYRIVSDERKAVEQQISDLEQRNARLGRTPESLTTEGTYQALQKQKAQLDQEFEPAQTAIKQVQRQAAEYFNAPFERLVYGATDGKYSYFTTDIINLNKDVEDKIIDRFDDAPEETKVKWYKGSLPVEAKEAIINSAKNEVLTDNYNVLKKDADNYIKNVKDNPSIPLEEKLKFQKEFKERSEGFNAQLALDYSGKLLKNNFKITDTNRNIDEAIPNSKYEGFIPDQLDNLSTFAEGMAQVVAKVRTAIPSFALMGAEKFNQLTGISRPEDYTPIEATMDLINDTTNLNFLPSSQTKRGDIVVDGEWNPSLYSAGKTIAKTLPFTLKIMSDVKKGRLEGTPQSMIAQLINPKYSKDFADKLRVVETAYKGTLADNYRDAKDMGMDDSKAFLYANVLSLAEGVSENIMPDYKYLDSLTGASLKAAFKGGLKQAVTKQAAKNVTKDFFKNIALELGEEEVVLATEDALKYSLLLNHKNSEFFNMGRQKELVATTALLSGTLGTFSANKKFKQNKTDLYNTIHNNIYDLQDAFLDEIDSPLNDQKAKEALITAYKFANDISAAISNAPENVTADQIDLLVQKKNLEEKKKNIDTAFHPDINEEIAGIDAKIRELAKMPAAVEEITPAVEEVKPVEIDNRPISERQAEAESKIKRKDLFTGVGDFSTELGGSDASAVPVSHREVNGIELVEYAHPKTGSVDVIVTGKSNNDFVGFYRIYENGKPTNKWSSKFENQSRNKEDFKTMISGVQSLLPEGHEYTEKTSISTDGLRVWGQQLERGYELQTDENGNLVTNEVAINGDAIVNELGIDVNQGNFDNISVTNNKQFQSVKKSLLPYLQKFGLNESNIRNVNGTVEIDLPVLKKSTKKAAAVEEVKPVAVKPSGQKVTDIINRPATLESQAGVRLETPIEGDVYQEGQRVIFEDKNKKTYDLGNIDEVSDKTVEELGIKPQEEMVSLTPEGKIKVGGNEWNMQSELPNYGIEYDKDGNVKAVSLKDDAGKTVMYDGQVAEDAAYQVLLKQTETPEQRQAINEILENDEELNRQLREAEEATQAAAAEVTEPGAPKTQAEQYSEELDKTKESDPEAYWSVSPVSAADAAKGTIIDTPDGAAIVKPDGDIAGLFKKATSKAKGVAQDLLKRAIAAGGKKLDNYDTYLTPQYIKAGFRVVSRTPFNEKYAPPGWNKEKHGTPDVVAMIYDPEGKLDIEEKTFDDPDTGYDEAIAYRDSLLEPSIEAELEGLTKLFDESEKGFRMSQVDNAKEALKGILPGVKFIVHETNEAYNKAVGDSSSGTYIMYANGDKVIHINKKNANGRTVAHEVFHAVILDKIKGDKAIQEITARMVDAVYKTASPELRAKLDAFAAMYSDKSIRDEERLAELIGIIADGYPQMSPANKSIVKRWLDALAKAFGLKPFTDNEVIDLLNTLARKVSTGELISEADVSILGPSKETIKRDVKRFQNDFVDPVSKIEFVYDKNTDTFKELEKEGYITKNKSIRDFNGKFMLLHQPDGAFSGLIYKNGELLVEGKGGVYYPIKFHKDGYFWASTSTTAKKMAEDLNKVYDANNGQILMALTSAKYDKLLSSTTAANGIMEIMLSKAFDKNFSINKQQIKTSLINAANKIVVVNGKNVGLGLKIKKGSTLEEVKSEIAEKLGPDNSVFGDRKMFAESLISNVADIIKNNPKAVEQFNNFFKEGIKDKQFKGTKTKGSNLIKISATNLTRAISEMLTEPMLKEGVDRINGGQVYAILELNGKVIDIPSKKHESYPKAIQSKDLGNKVKLHILTDRVKWNNVFEDPETGDIVSENREKNIYPSFGVSTTGLKLNTKNLPAEEKTIIRKQIVGENANLSQNVRDNLDVARDMESSKKSDKEIRLATGWERGADKKWRYEVPDNIPFLKDTVKTVGVFLSEDKDTNQLSQKANYFLPKELLDLYPQLNDITIKFDKVGDESEGSYDPTTKTIEVSIGIYPSSTVSSLIHEVQHAIQEIEGFAEGGSLSSSAKLAILSLEKKLGKRIEKTTRDEMVSLKLNKKEENFRTFILNSFYKAKNQKQLLKLIDKESYSVYRKLVGEVESRNVERRMNATPEERRKTTLKETEDVAREDQIIFFKRSQLQDEGVTIEAKNNTLYTVNDNGKTVGSMELTSNKVLGKGYLSVDLSKLNEKYIGKGIGLDLYRTVANKLKDKGIVLTSSVFRNDKSDRVWKSLEKSGEAVKIYSDIRLKDSVYALVNPEVRRSQKVEWEESRIGKGDKAITDRQPVLQNAAERYANKEISYEEYLKIKDVTSPIKPITDFIEPAKEEDIRFAVGINAEGKTNLKFDKGTLLGLRLDINAYINKNIWAITIHAPGKGKVLSYNNVARLKNVTFGSNAKDALNIARHKINKATIARMHGEWIPIDGNTSEEKGKSAMKFVESIVNNPEWSQVGMNPFRHSWFYDRADGKPVLAADELIQIGGLVYAKNVVKTTPYDKAFEFIDQEGDLMRFQQAKSIDEIISIAKQSNYSDAAITAFLKAKGFSDAQIANAMSKPTITEDEAYDKFRSEAKKSREEITNKKTVKEYLKEKYQNILKNWSNRQVEAQSLLSKTGMVNTLNLSINSHGYSGKAKRLFQKSYDKIYKGLSTEKRNILDEVIQAKRFIAIDNNRAERGLDPVKHPNYLNKQESQMFLDKLKKEIGDKEFNNITARADEYFSTYKKLLKDVYENGLISKESYDSMSDLDYQPRVFLQFVTDFEGDLKTPKNSVDSTSLSSDQIKSMKEGDVNSLVTNSEWLLSNSLVARTNAMAKNNINRRFMTDEFPKAKERFDKLDPRSLKGDDVRFYKYFKDLQSKVIDNPIIGYTKEGNPKYKYDDLKSPLNFTKAYYYVDGVQNQFFLEDGLHKSWNDNVDGFLSRDAKEMLSYASGSALVKAIATGNNPAFPIVNTPRDLMFTAAFSDEYSNLTPVALGQIGSDVIKSIKEIAKKDSDIVNKYYEYGGAMDFLSSQGTLKKDSLLGTFIDKMVPPNVKDSTKTVFNAVTLKKISEYSELMFRLGIFQRSVNNSLKELGIRSMSEISDKQQVDDIYNSAVASARGILDFNKGGVASKDLESIIPYINVAFQGGSVALNAFKKNPVATTSRIFQIATMASTIPAGLSLFLIAASKGDDDEDKTAHEIYLDAMAGVSKYQKSKYMNIVTGEKNEDGQYRVIKIAKAQELSPVISVTDDITENMIRGVIGKEPKSNETIIKNAMFSLKNNVLPIDVTNPFGTIVRNPVAKAWLTYQTGYDFFRDQPLAMGLEAKPAPYEGLDMKSVENFYKDLGPKYGLSPVRSKAFVESLITTPDTNPFVGIIYGGAEAMSSNKDAKSIGEDLANNIYKSTGKRIVSYTSDFNRNLEAKQKLEKQIDEIKLKDAILKSEIKLASDRFIAKDITKEQLMDEFKDLDPFDKKRALMKIRDKKMMKDVESNILDIKYEKSAKVKALMIQNYYGNILDKSDDSKEVIIQMKKAGNILTPEVIYELKNAQ